MKTLVTIEYSTDRWINRAQFIRRNANKPTYNGAARMIAKMLSEKSNEGKIYRPSEVSVHLISESIYA